MGRIKKAVGFVIKSIDFAESDRIVTVLSRESGKISLLAKGARKMESRFGAALELLTLSEFIYYHREGLKMLSQADILEAFSELKGQYERLEIALRCARWVNRLLEDDHAEEQVFTLFRQLLTALTSDPDKPKEAEGSRGYPKGAVTTPFRAAQDLYELAFQLKLLARLGVTPTLDRCVVCARIPKQSWFSMEKGGVLCERCLGGTEARGVALDAETARGLSMALRLPFHKLKRLRLSERVTALSQQLIEDFTAHHLRPLSIARRPPRGG